MHPHLLPPLISILYPQLMRAYWTRAVAIRPIRANAKTKLPFFIAQQLLFLTLKGALCAYVFRPRVAYTHNDETLSKLAQVPEQSEFTHSGS